MPPSPLLLAATTNAVYVAIAAICYLIVVCPHRCLYFCCRCLPPPLPLLAANVIGNGSNCGNSCGGNSASGNGGAFASFSGVMFKIQHIKSNKMNTKLDKGGGFVEWDRPVDQSEAARKPHSLAPWTRGGGSLHRRCHFWWGRWGQEWQNRHMSSLRSGS
jgi:hypothetical protein